MELQLKNIGMIKEANVKIDGLTVIAGENDTGKSTLGKVLYSLIRATSAGSNLSDIHSIGKFIGTFNALIDYIFNGQLSDKGTILFLHNNRTFNIGIKNNQVSLKNDKTINNEIEKKLITMFIETPVVWNFSDFFRDIAQVESQMEIKLDYPFLMKDLNFKLHIKNSFDGLNIKEELTSLMGGEFKKDEMGRYYFDKQGQKIELVNTATGIKYFGIFQVLSHNNYLNNNTVLVLDEPEVHLHPKWQLEMAKIIVELVKNGVKILVNSHSPYMIEALERYAEKAEVLADFYLAENGIIDKVDNDNSKTLAKIFHKLSAPYETFNEMDSEILKGG